MSKFTEGSLFFKKRVGTYADGWGEVTDENRNWEDAYRDRWAHDKIVRSTHGVNCTGSCSWKIYVKDGIVTWETQQTDYPPTPLRRSESRTAWMPSWRRVFVVSLQRSTRQASAHPRSPSRCMASRARSS